MPNAIIKGGTNSAWKAPFNGKRKDWVCAVDICGEKNPGYLSNCRKCGIDVRRGSL